MSPVLLSVAPSRDTDGGIVGLSEVTHPDDNRIEVADGSQKRRPSIRTSAGGWRPVTDPRRSLLVRTDFPNDTQWQQLTDEAQRESEDGVFRGFDG